MQGPVKSPPLPLPACLLSSSTTGEVAGALGCRHTLTLALPASYCSTATRLYLLPTRLYLLPPHSLKVAYTLEEEPILPEKMSKWVEVSK